jgi:hypothetical protein
MFLTTDTTSESIIAPVSSPSRSPTVVTGNSPYGRQRLGQPADRQSVASQGGAKEHDAAVTACFRVVDGICSGWSISALSLPRALPVMLQHRSPGLGGSKQRSPDPVASPKRQCYKNADTTITTPSGRMQWILNPSGWSISCSCFISLAQSTFQCVGTNGRQLRWVKQRSYRFESVASPKAVLRTPLHHHRPGAVESQPQWIVDLLLLFHLHLF